MLKTCPTADQLRRLLADQLEEFQEHAIGNHVEECPLCQDSLEQLTITDIGPLVPWFRKTVSGDRSKEKSTPTFCTLSNVIRRQAYLGPMNRLGPTAL